jgi:catechol 2,3-dioxygenase-like lactoylglutathione lyase family enzyme
MAVKVLELHHHGIRVGPDPEGLKKALAFYRDVLGLTPDPGRPEIPGVPGYWMEVDGRAQVHLMGVTGSSKYAKGGRQDPTLTHVALAVPDIQEAKRELDQLGVNYWTTVGIVGPHTEQVFMDDPFGNLIELHQAGTCRCNRSARETASAAAGTMS